MERNIDEQMLQLFGAYLQEQEKCASTIKKYQRDADKLFEFLDRDKRINRQILTTFKEYLIERYAAVSVNSIIVSVNSFFKFQGWDDLRIKSLRIQRSVFCPAEKEISKSEYALLLDTAKAKGDLRIYYIMMTICSTGIRVSELPYITIEALKKGQAVVNNKGKIRTVMIPKELCRRLLVYGGKQKIKQGKVFVTKNKKAIDRSNIWREMKRLSSEAGIPLRKVFPHNLRHLFARTYYRKQKDIVRLADILGHSNIETTRIYTVSSGKEHARQLDLLGLII